MSELKRCPGEMTRRGLMRSTMAASLGYVLGRHYIPSAWAAEDKKKAPGDKPSGTVPEYVVAKGKCQRVILCWMGGGPSHLDTFDPKPGTKQSGGVNGVEAADGLQISEKLPKLAKLGGKYMTVLRGVHSKEGDHGQASHMMHTGYREQAGVSFPSLGSIVCAESKDGPSSELPSYVAINGQGGGAGFYGAQYAPFSVSAGNQIPDLTMGGDRGGYMRRGKGDTGSMTSSDSAMKARRDLLDGLDKYYGGQTGAPLAVEHQKTYERAIKLATSPLTKLFECKGTEASHYGMSGFAKACYVAKQLVSKGGVRFVEIDRGGWDTHANNDTATKANCDDIDNPMAKLIEELAYDGLLSTTMVIWMGEFGRTPDINASGGRDHYPRCYSVMLAGGGVKGGQFVGKSNPSGHEPEGSGISVPDMFHTICEACGIDATKVRESADGRPIQVADRGSKLIPGVFGA